MTLQVDPRGSHHIYTYDDMGRVEHDQDPAGGYSNFSVSEGIDFRTVTRTTANGRVTVYDWDRNANGSSTYTVTLPTGLSNTQVIDTSGTTTTTFADGMIVTQTLVPDPVFGMDAATTNVSTRTPANLVRSQTTARSVTLSNASDPLSVTGVTETMTETMSPTNRVTTRAYSESGLPLGTAGRWTTTSPGSRVSTALLDVKGRVVSTSSTGTLPVELSYDTLGRLQSTEQGTERFTDFAYHATTGFLTSQTNALSEVTSYGNDAVGRVTTTTRADASQIGFEYDGESNLIGLTPPARAEHEMTYTSVDLAEDYEPPIVGATPTLTHNGYNLDRQLTSVTQPDQQEQLYSYGATNGRLETAAIPGAGTYTYNYDTAGRLSSVTTNGGFGSVTFGYDGSLTTTTTVAGPQSVSDNGTPVWSGTIAGSVVQGYNSVFEVQSVNVLGASGAPNGFGTSYGRDSDDLVTSIAPLTTPSSVPTMTLVRSSLDGHLASTTLGVVTSAYDVDVSSSTPGTGDLLGLSASVSGVEVFGTSYLRDDLGRITQVDEIAEGVSRTRKYAYDEVGRLIAVRDGADVLLSEYEYDGNGARIRVVTALQDVELGVDLGCGAGLIAPVDAQDRLCRYGDYEYAYDENGRLASKTHVSVSTDVTEYLYDGLGRLRAAELPSGERIDYVLDALGRRIGKVVDGDLVKGWLYGQDSLRPLAQYNASGQIEATFVYETGVNVPDYIVQNSGAVLRVVTDHLGSVRLVVNVISGAVVQRMDYDEFGNVTVDSAPDFQPFGFAGGIYDADTRLVRFGEREYDAVTGRWTAKDPILFDGGTTNLYEYIANDPVNGTDPDGQKRRREQPKECENYSTCDCEAAFQCCLEYDDDLLCYKRRILCRDQCQGEPAACEDGNANPP